MGKKHLLLLVAFIVTIFYSCNKSESGTDNQEQKQTEALDVSILNDEIIGYIVDSIGADGIIKFSSDIPEVNVPKVGSAIFIPISDKTPYGLLARVESVKKDNYIYVKTSPISLDEAFGTLSIGKSNSVKKELIGVFDENGKELSFEIEDTTDINLIQNSSTKNNIKTRGVDLFKFDSDCIKIPVSLYHNEKGNDKNEKGNDKIDVKGTIYVGFHNFDLNIDINNFSLNSIDLNVTPYIKISLNHDVSSERNLELSERILQLRYRLTYITQTGIPIIIPLTLYVDGSCGIKGEMSANIGLQHEYSCNCIATYKNGEWKSQTSHSDNKKNKWIASEFDVRGEIYSGVKLGLLVGLYSATTGIGFNIKPNYSLSANVTLSSENLLNTNPNVDLSIKIGSEVYCVAKLFGRKMMKYTAEFPDYILWSSTIHLLPKVENIEVKPEETSAEIQWSHDTYYFLEFAETGMTVFDSDKQTIIKSFRPEKPISNDIDYKQFKVEVAGLEEGKTYYLAPFVYWGDYMFYGEMIEFKTKEVEYNISVDTRYATDISSSRATVKGKLNNYNPNIKIKKIGFYYNTSGIKDPNESKFIDATLKEDGTFKATLTNLTKNTLYYYYAYVETNKELWGYRESFSTTDTKKMYKFRIQIDSQTKTFISYDDTFTAEYKNNRINFSKIIYGPLEVTPFTSISYTVEWYEEGYDKQLRGENIGEKKLWIKIFRATSGSTGIDISLDYYDDVLSTEWLNDPSEYTWYTAWPTLSHGKYPVKVKLTLLESYEE
jgi:hypothetical protein